MTETSLPRVLVVDDEVAHMRALCDTLRDQGYHTAGCTSGGEALHVLKGEQFDLLLADLMMPGLDGIGLLQAAREHDPSLVGVIMTGEGTIGTAVEAMKAGAIDYILKPFKLRIILPVLSRALAMRRLRMENADLQRRLLERAAELEAANKELESFSYSVSHDLRSPLRAINGYCRILEEDFGATLSAEHRRLFDVIVESGRKMSALIDDLLAFSRLGRQPVHTEPVDMTFLVKDVWAEVRASWPETSPRFKLRTLPATRADRALLKQVWTNLLSNAVKYSGKRQQPIVEVGGEEEGKEIVYWVKDNGTGFDMQYAGKLFMVFQRLHSESEFPGTGVGLAIVQRIVTRHGGRVWAEAQKDKGATFYFSLPAMSDAR